MKVGLCVLAATALALFDAGEIRERAESGLGRGMPEREAALARGFVLGQDEDIDPGTVEDFRRSGLGHLLAVSGQNVVLLALLATPLLGALGLPLRDRLLWLVGLIAFYVVLAGAGPSIQRAGVMGVLGLVATLLGRRSSRLYSLAVAAALTVAVDPGIATEVGWQLSFAAVLGIALLAAPLSAALRARLRIGGHLGRALADGAAMTTAATLATAPLVAFHFGETSTVTLLANLLAMPAVAPAMWLGMLGAAAAQVPGAPLEAINGLNALLLAYVAQVASWCAAPGWASVEVGIGLGGLAASYAALVATVGLARRLPGAAFAAGALAFALLGAGVALHGAAPAPAAPTSGLRVTVLDVGQGDAILLQPAGAPAVLVDGGPPGEGLARKLGEAGVGELGAAFVTHDQADHAGGVEEIIGAIPVGRLYYSALAAPTREAAEEARTVPERLAAGRVISSGELRIEVLWPPGALLGEGPGDDPNRLSLVLLARWREFSILLCGDAEAEAVPIDPGPVDVLKVAHHGSEDAGLDALLERAFPRLAVISAGVGNPHGHPAPETLADLAGHGVRVVRTDRGGAIVIEVREGRMRVERRG